jgi:predicted transcriptional regulator
MRQTRRPTPDPGGGHAAAVVVSGEHHSVSSKDHWSMKKIAARALMNKGVAYASPHWSLLELAQFLDDQSIHGAPVQDSSGNLIGVVSRSDVNRAISESLMDADGKPAFRTVNEDGDVEDMETDLPTYNPAEELTVSEIMQPNAITMDADVTVGEVAKRMFDESTSRVLLTEKSRIVGIISSTDLLQAVVQYEGL